jgi:signal transduction histidine kinase
MTPGKFTVDTHLFRELGELLVGRDSTALVELIKNAYDADATEIIVNGVSLDNPAEGYIVIDDNGIGMEPQQFQNGFLRIASRLKEQEKRVSRRFKRRFTGAKGIGRLAAHKLAKVLDIYSIPWDANGAKKDAIFARIDWDTIEAKETLDEVPDIEIKNISIPQSSKTGTEITLRHLRRRWTPAERGRFIAEAQTFEPPKVLISPLPRNVVERELLFDTPLVRDSSNADPGFHIELRGDFASGEEFWQAVVHAANWIIEIDVQQGRSTVQCSIAPTRQTVREYPNARRQDFSFDHPNPDSGPFFQARILLREGRLSDSQEVRTWANQASGVRVFMEGFRVLPYGEPGNDWLSLDLDYTRRSRDLNVLSNRSYFGAVFLTQERGPSLKMLVNREGFVPDAAFESLREIVRRGIALSTRLRAAVKAQAEQEQKYRMAGGQAEQEQVPTDTSVVSLREPLESATDGLATTQRAITTPTASLEESIADMKRRLAAGDYAGVEERLARVSQAASTLISEQAMLRVLASVGTQMASFVHEISGLLGIAESVYEVVGRLREEPSLPRASQQKLATLQAALGDLKRSLERQASYLLDIVTPDARRRRSRQSLADRFNAGARLVERLAERREIRILNEIPPELRSPPMFPAELITIFSNLLTNAVKATGKGGTVRATAQRRDDGAISLVIENTGVAVNIAEAERWFKPFESTTVEVDPILGQGMGLGLPITRSMLEEYGAEIRFVQPGHGYATAVEIVFPQ